MADLGSVSGITVEEDELSNWAASRRIRARASASSKHSVAAQQSRQRPWQRWLIELVVVFLGVFLAALADDWRERRNERQTAERLANGLKSSFEDLRRVDRSGYAEFMAEAKRFEADVTAGKRPPYHFQRARSAQRPPTGIWEAFLAADGAKLFPPDLIFDLARFYNGFNNFADRTQVYYRFVEDEVLPAADDRHAAYVPGTTKLRPRWREQHERSKELAEMLHRLAERTEELEPRLMAVVR